MLTSSGQGALWDCFLRFPHISAVGPPVLRETLGHGLEETRCRIKSLYRKEEVGSGYVTSLRPLSWQEAEPGTVWPSHPYGAAVGSSQLLLWGMSVWGVTFTPFSFTATLNVFSVTRKTLVLALDSARSGVNSARQAMLPVRDAAPSPGSRARRSPAGAAGKFQARPADTRSVPGMFPDMVGWDAL